MDLTMGLPALASVEADETVEQLALLTQRAVESRRQSRVDGGPLGRRCAFGWDRPGTFARFSGIAEVTENARRYGRSSAMYFLMPGTHPAVEKVIELAAMLRPAG